MQVTKNPSCRPAAPALVCLSRSDSDLINAACALSQQSWFEWTRKALISKAQDELMDAEYRCSTHRYDQQHAAEWVTPESLYA